MTTLTAIKSAVDALYKSTPHIHIDVHISRPKLHLVNEPATITGVYPHFFTVTATGRQHTIHYADVLTGQITILELQKQTV